MLRYHKHNHILLFLIPTLLFILVLYFILPFGSEYSMDDLIEQPSISGTFRSLMAEEFAAQAIAYNNPKTDDWVIPVTSIQRGGNQLSNTTIRFTSYADTWRTDHYHGGYDIVNVGYTSKCPYSRGSSCPDTCLIAPVTGTVVQVKNVTNNGKTRWQTGSNSDNSYVCIKGEGGSNDGLYFCVLHMSDIPSGITVGSKVQQGQVIGYQCSQGKSTGPHCHFHITTCSTNPYGNVSQRLLDMNYAERFVLHSSISEIVGSTKLGSIKDTINNKPRYDSEVVEVK